MFMRMSGIQSPWGDQVVFSFDLADGLHWLLVDP